MKPNFALSLSFEGIRLLHRAAGGWRVVGEVSLEAEDMAAELAVLRKTATALEPGGLRSKLLIPNEQIKYLTIDTPDMSLDDRRTAAREALDGATPYAVADLAFDISTDGARTHVAAVAHETLAEAEGFATEHRLHPVCFAAVPDDQPYLGAPYFGQTKAAEDLLDAGDLVEPDEIAVVVIGDIIPPTGQIHAPAPSPLVPDVNGITVAIDTPQAAPATTKPAETETLAKSTAPEKTGGAVNPTEKPIAEPKPEPKAELETAVPPPPADAPTATKPHIAVSRPIDPAPVAAPLAPATPPKIGFASRRNADTPPEATDARKDPAPSLGGQRRDAASSPAPVLPLTTTSVPAAAPSPAAAPLAPAVLTQKIPVPVADGDSGAIKPDSTSLTSAMPKMTSTGGFLSRRKPKSAPHLNTQSTAAPTTTAPASEAERMTVFGARRTDVRGKPRFLGLILTAALLVFLAGVAAWASIFLDDGMSLSRLFGDRSPRATASGPTAIDPQPNAPEITVDEAAIETASLNSDLTDEDGAVLDALRQPEAPRPLPELTEDEVEARYAATGIWPRAPIVPPEPTGAIDIEDLYLTSIDPVSTSADAVALPDVTSFTSDVVLASVATPAPAGTQFALGADGLVIPTAQGALSPDGFTVYLGRPTLVPPATLTRAIDTAEDIDTGNTLVAFRPRERPGDLAETTERAQLDGLTRTELAGFRPALRPQSLQEQVEEVTEVAAVDTSAAVAAALATPPAIENATKYAVTVSRRPDTRPRNFARIVKRAERSAPQETQVASAATVAPRAVTPSIPSKASVAKQATVKNAINLRNVNLIGVYGKPSSRRALVRLSNGRYQKVEVGDRLDGGQVSAIGDSELRYVKRGRNVVLTMPKS